MAKAEAQDDTQELPEPTETLEQTQDLPEPIETQEMQEQTQELPEPMETQEQTQEVVRSKSDGEAKDNSEMAASEAVMPGATATPTATVSRMDPVPVPKAAADSA